MTQSRVNIHGLVIACQSSSPGLPRHVLRPFWFFLEDHGEDHRAHGTDGTPTAVIHVEAQAAPYNTFPRLPSRFSTPRNVVYEGDGLKIVDYFGRGAVVQDERRQVYRVYSADDNLLREIVYLLVLSLLGRYCDRTGVLRIHALAVSKGDRAFLFTMPPGAGKSTLAFALLEAGNVRYLSDDDPLFDRQGRILTFPRALGLIDRDKLAPIPERFISRVDRMEFGTKYFVDLAYWPDRIERRPLTDIVVVTARRVLNGESTIAPISRLRLLRRLVRDAVIGIGLYQGLEFLVHRSVNEVWAKVPVLFRRLRLAARLARRARAFEMVLTNDAAATGRAVTAFIERES
jgi:hypothetical protein